MSAAPGSGALTTPIGAELAERVLALIDRAAQADATNPISEHAVHAVHADAPVRHLIWTLDSGDVVAYAQVQPGNSPHPAMVEAVVDPENRRCGIGTELVREALGAAGPDARIWAHGDLPAAQALAARLGLVSRRELLQLRRTADAGVLPELVIPNGVIVESYRGPGVDAELLAVNAAAFSWHPEQGAWTERDIADRRAQSWFDPRGFFLARDANSGELLGFHWTKVHSAAVGEPERGEVYVVAVSPHAQGRGLGRMLTLAGLHYLADRGLDTVLLYVEGDNAAALHTYDRLGFTRFHTDVAYGVPLHR